MAKQGDKMKMALAILILLLVPAICLAQATKKIPVEVSHTGKDRGGLAVAFALKEAIRTSQSFRLVDDEAVPSPPRIVIVLVSLIVETGSPRTPVGTALSITIVYDSASTEGGGIYLLSTVHTCGRQERERCGRNMLPLINEAVEYLREDLPSLWKKLYDE